MHDATDGDDLSTTPTPRTTEMEPDEIAQQSQSDAPAPAPSRPEPTARTAALSRPGPAVRARAPARVLRRCGAGQGRRPRVPRQRGDRDHRPLGLRQVDDGALHQPHARGDPGRARRGQGAARRLRRVRLRGRRRRGAPGDRDGLPEAEPVPDDVDLRQRRRRPATDLARAQRRAATCTQGRGRAARRRAVGGGQGPAVRARRGALGRPAAAAVHRALARRRPRGDPDGRALLGA